MNTARIAGIILIVAGFSTGGFSFTQGATAAKLSPMELTVTEKKSVNIPQWAESGCHSLGRHRAGDGVA